MSSDYGENIRISLFGASHAPEIGVEIDGIPKDTVLDDEYITAFMTRRAPGRDALSSQRREKDIPEIVSGMENGKTNGKTLRAVIKNTDVKSTDYADIMNKPRPSHADYPAYVKYGKNYDFRGGGQFSGRMTAPLCFAGAIFKKLLENSGIYIGAHILSVGDIADDRFSLEPDTAELFSASKKDFPVLNDEKGKLMQNKILSAKENLDSVGGTIECAVTGIDAGMGEPFFGGIEGYISRAVFGIPAVKGIEFGCGFSGMRNPGSQYNDEYFVHNGRVKTYSNNNGGILGGLSTGMPIVFSAAVKTTPSIGTEQKTVDLSTMTDTRITVNGRHDPCILKRAVPCIEAAAAIAVYDMLRSGK